jgi:phosphohistidine phosphatase
MLNSFQQIVVLVRHADAKSTEEDPSRPLSVTGRQQAERMASWLRKLDPDLDEIRHSGKARARETAEVFAARIGIKTSRIREVPGLAPNGDVEAVAADLGIADGSLMLVGHLPFLARLASRLATGDPDGLDMKFAKAGVAVLARVAGGWQLVALLSQEMC